MSFSVIGSVKHLVTEYRRFLRSTYRLADPKLREQFERHIDEADVLVKGPYVTLAQDSAVGQTLDQLVKDEIGHSDLTKLHWTFGKSPVYQHQENALRRVELSRRNAIVKTGTGSGKTEAFLLPILSGVMQMRAQGIQGTKAILLYPMNALANDQLGRIRELIRDSGVGVTFAMYTGESESVAPMLGEPVQGNELIRRDQIRATPPDILLTNYKELEFLLVRKVDRALFGPSLRYLVLDEIHSYRGALATEIACLIRRLKARAGVTTGELRCIGTSATVSQDAGGDAALARFVSELFGEPFLPDDIIGETLVAKVPSERPYTPPFMRLNTGGLQDFPYEDESRLLELASRLTGLTAASGSVTKRIRQMLDGNEAVALLEKECLQPKSLNELCETFRTEFSATAELARDDLRAIIEAYLLVGSIGSDNDPPVLRPKLHTFFQGVYDVGLCMNPECRELVRDGSETCIKCGSAVRPAALCRTCGQDFVKVRFDTEDPTKTYPNDSFTSDDSTGFITPRIHVEAGDEDEGVDADTNGSVPRLRRRITSARQRLVKQYICHDTGRVFDKRPQSEIALVSEQLVLRGKGNTCPACNSSYTKGDILTLLRSGVASSTSVLATHHLDRLPPSDRKILIFADNRQEAAHQAGYMGDRHREFAVRHAIEQVVRESDGGVGLTVISHKLLEKFQAMGLARWRLISEEQKFWRKALEFEAASEFCTATHQRISLENLALVEAQYELLEQLVLDKRFLEACSTASISPENGAILLRAILDYMRRRRAVSFDFYQKFLDPKREPWSILAVEPYLVAFPERESVAQFFMLDRPEAARSGAVGGCQFHAFVKDSARGSVGGLMNMVRTKANLGEANADTWVREMVPLLQEYEILEAPPILPATARRAIGRAVSFQIASRVIKLVPAKTGYRCAKCQIWRPYRGLSCYATTRCSGGAADLREARALYDRYYERLYTADVPRRLVVREHTAQIDQKDRAKRESDFKEGRLEALVCSPTLELGVNIGDLFTVLLRNTPPTPANYVQRAGRAGRRLRIGFVSTFCGVGSHDRHCFDDPAWLVRGEFRPPSVRLDNGKIIARHIRSFVLEEIHEQLPQVMQEFIDDLDNPKELQLDTTRPALDEMKARTTELANRALAAFGKDIELDSAFFQETVGEMPTAIGLILANWHLRIKQLHEEFHYYDTITADAQARQKAAARRRAYRELTTDQREAYVLNYLSSEGLLPSYQFPTDTFSLDPGVNDTPALRRPAWIALFEFAPGNLIYANGHKLKSIRAFFEGRNRAASGGREGGLETSGRVRPFCFCSSCGYATEETPNNCPECRAPMRAKLDVAFVEAFEAEENTQITSAEEGRQRVYFERRENIISDGNVETEIFPYPFSHLEFRHQAKLLVTNWGKKTLADDQGERFRLCPSCGKHKPQSLTDKADQRWEEDHLRRCSGRIHEYCLGYEFSADALLLPIPQRLIPGDTADSFCRTLGTALVEGAVELLEVEPDELAFFHHPVPGVGSVLAFYETVPGGAGYLRTVARRLPELSAISIRRLFDHDCSGACYRCLKNYRNQPFHALLDKNLVRDALFQFSSHELLKQPYKGKPNDAILLSDAWLQDQLDLSRQPQTKGTAIEKKLLAAIQRAGRLPLPFKQREFREGEKLLTIADFAYENQKIAIYCDGFAYHGTAEKLSSDAYKRNLLQAQGWLVLTFWGQTILRTPERCEEQIWRAFNSRREKPR